MANFSSSIAYTVYILLTNISSTEQANIGIIIITIQILFDLILYYIPHSCGINYINYHLTISQFFYISPCLIHKKKDYNGMLSCLLVTLSYVSCGNNLLTVTYTCVPLMIYSIIASLWFVYGILSTVEIKYLYESPKQQIKEKLCSTSNAKLTCLWFMRNSIWLPIQLMTEWAV